jgi:hypothetical protein
MAIAPKTGKAQVDTTFLDAAGAFCSTGSCASYFLAKTPHGLLEAGADTSLDGLKKFQKLPGVEDAGATVPHGGGVVVTAGATIPHGLACEGGVVVVAGGVVVVVGITGLSVAQGF